MIQMSNRLGMVALLVALVAPMAPVAAAEAKTPPLLVRLASIETLTRQFFLLAEKVNRKAEAEQLKNALQSVTGPGGIQGFDPSKPIGIYGSIGPNGLDSTGVILVPASDETAMLAALKKLAGVIGGNLVEAKGKGLHTLNLDQSPFPIFLRFTKGYCWATLKDEAPLADSALPDPAKLLQAPAGSVARLHFDLAAVPENLRITAVEALKQSIAMAREKAPADETPAARTFRLQMSDMMEGGLIQFLKEGGALDLEMGLDEKTEDLRLEARMETIENSSLGKAMEAMGSGPSIGRAVSGYGKTLSLSSYVMLPPDLRKAVVGVLEEGFAKAKNSDAGDSEKKMIAEVIDAIMPTLKSGVFDSGVALIPSKKEGLHTAALAFRVKDGAKVEGVIRAAVKQLGEKLEGKVKLDVATYAGVKVHEISGNDSKAREMLGDGPAFLAVRNDMVLITAGPEALALLKDMASVAPVTGSMMQAELGLASIVKLGDSNVPKELVRKASAKAFGDKAGIDRARIEVTSGKGIGLKVTANLAILEFLTMLDPSRD